MDTADLLATRLTHTIEERIRTQPRTMQRMIGPSEIGNPCDHCLAARLAGWEKLEHAIPWLPFIGTAVHAELERIFTTQRDELTYLVEQHVTVGKLGNKPITGSADLFIPRVRGIGSGGVNIDWKIVGNTTLDRVRREAHPGAQYEIQAHLYGLGWENAGERVEQVAIAFLPRQKQRLTDAYWWHADYNPDIAHAALHRLNNLYSTLAVIHANLGKEKTDHYISTLPRTEGCWDCKKYADYQPPKSASFNEALNIPTT